MSEFFARVFEEVSPAEIEARRQESFEQSVIKAIMRTVGNPIAMRELASSSDRMFGKKMLSFRWFYEVFPDFPVILGSQKIPYVHKISGAQLFGTGFAKLPMFKELQEFVTAENLDMDTSHVGVVFQWPGASGGTMMVLHAYPTEQDNLADPDLREARGTRIIRKYGNPANVYTIESLKDLVLAIGDDWITDQNL